MTSWIKGKQELVENTLLLFSQTKQACKELDINCSVVALLTNALGTTEDIYNSINRVEVAQKATTILNTNNLIH